MLLSRYAIGETFLSILLLAASACLAASALKMDILQSLFCKSSYLFAILASLTSNSTVTFKNHSNNLFSKANLSFSHFNVKNNLIMLAVMW